MEFGVFFEEPLIVLVLLRDLTGGVAVAPFLERLAAVRDRDAFLEVNLTESSK